MKIKIDEWADWKTNYPDFSEYKNIETLDELFELLKEKTIKIPVTYLQYNYETKELEVISDRNFI